MSITTQIKTRDAYGVTYANPADPDMTVRFKHASAKKVINGVTVLNNVSEVIVNDTVSFDVGKQTATDNISIRLRVSGAQASKARIIALLKSLCVQVPTWADENVLSGFEPVTVPVDPSV